MRPQDPYCSPPPQQARGTPRCQAPPGVFGSQSPQRSGLPGPPAAALSPLAAIPFPVHLSQKACGTARPRDSGGCTAPARQKGGIRQWAVPWLDVSIPGPKARALGSSPSSQRGAQASSLQGIPGKGLTLGKLLPCHEAGASPAGRENSSTLLCFPPPPLH